MTRIALAFATLALAACKTAAPLDQRPPLPFHVALAPVASADVRTDLRAGSGGDATEMRIAPDERLQSALTRAIAAALRERAFAQVTILPPATTDPDPAAVAKRDAELVRGAREHGADLLLCVDLAVQPILREEKNGVFWVNFPLFLIGGPFGWWIPDHTYTADAQVTGWFYDPRALGGGADEAALRASRELASASRRAERMDLRFTERADDAGDYLLSMVWPCGFLAVESDELEAELAARVVDQLAKGLARSVLEQSAELERGDAPFALDLTRSGIASDGNGSHVLRGVVRLRPTREIETLGSWRVRVGDEPARSRSFAARPAAEGGELLFAIEEPLGRLDGAASVRLEIEAGERAPEVRSYTFRIRPERTTSVGH